MQGVCVRWQVVLRTHVGCEFGQWIWQRGQEGKSRRSRRCIEDFLKQLGCWVDGRTEGQNFAKMELDEVNEEKILNLLLKGSSKAGECHDGCILPRRAIRKN